MRDFTSYLRVSTDKQGILGLGMEAQREAVARYVSGRGQILGEYVEVERGRKTDRPKLLAAIAECRKLRTTLVIAKLDRLARNVAFIANLMNSDIEFVAVDMPTANRLTIHILAAVAEHEREMISERTKAALAAAKARGTRLGNPRWSEALEKARGAVNYVPVPPDVLQLIGQMNREGLVLREIAGRLNSLGVRTPQGFHWYASTVSSALARFPVNQKARKADITKGREDESGLSGLMPFSGLNGFRYTAIPSISPLSAGRRGSIEGNITMADLAESLRMLDAFTSVGATHFDITFTDIEGQKRGFRAEQSARQLRNSLPHLLPGLTERQQNLIIRPHSEKVDFVQLDDLNAEQVQPLGAVSCLILETSPGNHQAWVAVSDLEKLEAKDFARRLRKGTGADASASGATRLAGTSNYKRKYEPAFPTVIILQAAPGRITAKAQLEALGLVATPEPVYDAPASPFRVSSGRSWPDYQRCVQGAPMSTEKKPDISRADFFFAMMAAQRGFSPEQIAAELMRVSKKAHENGERYCEVTAANAVAAAERGKHRSRA